MQWSVFECRVTETELERLRQRLCKTMDADEDSIRIYRPAAGGRRGGVHMAATAMWISRSP